MLDSYNRKITYLRVSVTDRCNLRCQYCMPEEGIQLLKHKDVLSLEEIAEVIREGAKLGLKKIRLTGGEPLVRKGIVQLVEMIKQIQGIEEIAMTTNGILLKKYALDLKKAGLNRVNISLDTLDEGEFKSITRLGNIKDVKEGIKAARDAGLTPIKINVVKTKFSNKQNIDAIKQFCKDEDLNIRFIKQMDLETGDFSVVEGGEGGNCQICNRLRLMANGDVKPCLFSNNTFNVKKHGIKEAFQLALGAKPLEGSFNHNHKFYNIGG
ncbi:GTP 3',8-cyclase MoaA [Carboxylicivirga sp. M1479]|uniref:GTP 3',8-cyclase MoaA n=1 Tax=Carboxylicivirga sp. M1479 TaxID=2594476 RepID=UPI0011784830|nr:radical SAM protein [Carboxylicivirga sp. M1479]TRX70975.1 radical SAM protein [Carboxylicivirga sp. M1479]